MCACRSAIHEFPFSSVQHSVRWLRGKQQEEKENRAKEGGPGEVSADGPYQLRVCWPTLCSDHFLSSTTVCGDHGDVTAGGGAAFDFGAPTAARNAARTLRAMQLRRAVLLEGSPGVGKTALVAALAAASGDTIEPGLCVPFVLSET